MITKSRKLLWQHSSLGFLLGLIAVIPEYLYITKNGNGAGFIHALKIGYSSFILCSFPFVFAVICYYFGKSRLIIMNANEKLQVNENARKVLLEELLEYKFALDQSAIITVIDEHGKFKRVNENFVSLTGFKAKDVIGRSVWRLPSSLQKAGAFRDIKKIADSGQVWKGEIEYYKKDRTTCYTSAIIVPLSQKVDGNNICLVIQYDITAEKNAEIALRKSEEEKRIILSNTQTLICTHSMKGEITSINNAGTEMLGYAQHQILGQSIETFIDPRYSIDQYMTDIHTQGISEGYMKVISKTGEKRTLLYKNVICKEQGEKYIIGSAIDITQTLQAQRELDNQRDFTSQLIDESSNIVCVVDEQGKISLINKKFKTFFNLDESDVISTVSDAEGIRNDISALIKSEELEYIFETKNCIYECKIKESASGIFKWFKVQRTVFTDKRNNNYVLVIATDITEKHAAEVELIKAHKLVENSLKMKEQFISNMSHEIRTPLNAIIGFTTLLEDSSLNYQQKDYVQTVKIAGQNLLSIINDILDLSKIETGNIKLTNKPMNLPVVVRNVKKLLEPKVLEKKIYLNTFVSEAIPEIVYGDQVRLNQILINLAGNAVKFTNSGGVDIVVKQVKRADESKAYIHFTVKDSGIGIKKDKLDVIFQRYSQASQDIHRVFGGTGLGLSISKNLVELFGGEIKLSSEFGVGTSLSFVLPFDVYSGEIIKEPAEALINNKDFTFPLKILLAEDNNTNARLAIQLLKKRNFSVDRVKDGKEVLEALKFHTYDLILMDVQMIEQDGIETTRIIRTSPAEYANIPIIALTAHSFVGEKDVCENAGMNGYISKPFYPEELYNTIYTVMKENQSVPVEACS